MVTTADLHNDEKGSILKLLRCLVGDEGRSRVATSYCVTLI